MVPTNPELLELTYAIKLLAKTVEGVGEDLESVLERQGTIHADTQKLKDEVTEIAQKLELLPLVLAGKLEDLIAKRTDEAFEDVRQSLNEMRNKLWSIKKQIKEGTGSNPIPTPQQIEEWEKKHKKEEEDGLTIKQGKFKMNLPFSSGTLKTLKTLAVVLGSLFGLLAGGGGVWALIDKIRHLAH